MKRRAFFLALLFMGSSLSFAAEIESFANKEGTVCLEMASGKFGLRLIAAEGAHEVLGNGTLQRTQNLMGLDFEDSFGNQVKGTFDTQRKILDLQVVQADKWSPGAAAGAYGSFQMIRKKCTSHVLEQ